MRCTKRSLKWYAAMILAAGLAGVANATPDVNRDVEQLIAFRNQLKNETLKELGQRFVNDAEAAARFGELLDRLERFERDERPKIAAFMTNFAEKYGETRSEILDRLTAAGWQRKGGLVPGSLYLDIRGYLTEADATRDEVFEHIVKNAEQRWRVMSEHGSAAAIEGVAADLLAALEVAEKFRPNRPEARELRERIRKEKVEGDENRAREIAQAQWPGHVAAFAGPGDVDDLAARAFEWLIAKGDNPIAVAVRANWSPHRKTLEGEPINFALPLYVAYRSEKDPEQAIVLRMSLITGGAERTPAWVDHSVGDSFRMLIENIPAESKGPGGGGAGSRMDRLFPRRGPRASHHGRRLPSRSAMARARAA